jgi:16S rRNA (guanine966-N2)-methyltransferase
VVRVVSGVARGRKLDTPDGLDTRPTTDRVKEAVFNALGSLDAVIDAEVLDLFAGSGALGIEALSRGAASATFVDRSPAARRAITANLDRLGLADRATVVGADAAAFRPRPAAAPDLVLADPPYPFDGWQALTAALADHVAPEAVLVAESDREVALDGRWVVLRSKRYSGTVVQIARRAPLAGVAPEPPIGASA